MLTALTFEFEIQTQLNLNTVWLLPWTRFPIYFKPKKMGKCNAPEDCFGNK
jgi:hypothetical protein